MRTRFVIIFFLLFASLFSYVSAEIEKNIPADMLIRINKAGSNNEQINTVVALINSLGEVEFTDEYIVRFRRVDSAYNHLPDSLKEQVENKDLLVQRRADFYWEAGYQLNDLIETIKSFNGVGLTQEFATKLNNAWSQYEGLSDIKKVFFDKRYKKQSEKLKRTKTEYDNLKQSTENKAQIVVGKINAIGSINLTPECEQRINEACSQFNALDSLEQIYFAKNYTGNLNQLKNDTSLLRQMKEQSIANENNQIQLDEADQDTVIVVSQQVVPVIAKYKKPLWYSLIIIAVIVCGIALFIIIRFMKKKNKKENVDSSQKEPMVDASRLSLVEEKEKENEMSSEPSKSETPIEEPIQEESNQTAVEQTPAATPVDLPSEESVLTDWVVVGASVKGNGHIQSNMPCQDNNMFETLGDGWGIAIVSDGAGSAAHSDLGSKIVATRGIFHFKKLLENEEWIEKKKLPTDIEWLQKSYSVLKEIRNDVIMVAQKNNTDVKSLSATCLTVIYSPYGLLAVHVGDGRMGYKTMADEWKPMMTPHKGDEANQTIFLVSDFWSIPQYTMSGVLVPESVVVRESVKAFALMSDGCENTAWQCTALNSDTGKYYDRNLPFAGFFNPLEETLLTFSKENVPVEERQEKWFKFIESGTSGFVKEQDDKTMIYAINVGLFE